MNIDDRNTPRVMMMIVVSVVVFAHRLDVLLVTYPELVFAWQYFPHSKRGFLQVPKLILYAIQFVTSLASLDMS